MEHVRAANRVHFGLTCSSGFGPISAWIADTGIGDPLRMDKANYVRPRFWVVAWGVAIVVALLVAARCLPAAADGLGSLALILFLALSVYQTAWQAQVQPRRRPVPLETEPAQAYVRSRRVLLRLASKATISHRP